MFDFLIGWDKSLESFEKDIEASLRGEVRSWIPYAQIFCERVFKLYNSKDRYFSPYGIKLTLGSFLHDDGFCADFSRKTGFRNYGGLKDINEAANEIKHKGVPIVITEPQTHRILENLHDLSLKSYNYLEKSSIKEKYDVEYFKSIMEQKDKDIDETIQYADSIIQKKNEIIMELTDALEVMNEFSKEDIDNINVLKSKEEFYEKSIKLYNGLVDKLYQGSLQCMNRMRGVNIDDEFDFDEFDDLISGLYEKPADKKWHDFFFNNEDKPRKVQHDHTFFDGRSFMKGYEEYTDEPSMDDMEGDYYLP